MRYNGLILAVLASMLITSCGNRNNGADAYGNFETIDVIVSAEGTGRLVQLVAAEGNILKKGEDVGIVDTTDLNLKAGVLEAQKAAVATRLQTISAQTEVYQQQKSNLLVDRTRLVNLIRDKAATQKQLDDVDAGIRLADKQIQSTLAQKAGVSGEMDAITRQVAQVNEAIRKSHIINPIQGTVIEKYAEAGEFVNTGKPLYKIANLDTMILRVYVSGDLLPRVKTGGSVKVVIDQDKKNNSTLPGTISWISSTAEFTPKIIQTKSERVNLVYGVKVKVVNDGRIKIGMPGEVILEP